MVETRESEYQGLVFRVDNGDAVQDDAMEALTAIAQVTNPSAQAYHLSTIFPSSLSFFSWYASPLLLLPFPIRLLVLWSTMASAFMHHGMLSKQAAAACSKSADM